MSHRYGQKFVDHEESCPYLPQRKAVLPFYQPNFTDQPEKFDQALAEGVRRSSLFIYHTACPGCDACEPIRIPVADFAPRRRHRRVLTKTGAALRIEIEKPIVDDRRVELYNKHKIERGLGQPGSELDRWSLAEFLALTCCETWEFGYFIEDQLIGVAIADVGQNSMSAVYCYYDPQFDHLGIGNFSVLKQIETCREWGLKYLYLGFFVAGNDHMQYKATYLPHERLIAGRWQRFDSC